MVTATNDNGRSVPFLEEELYAAAEAILTAINSNNRAAEMVTSSSARSAIRDANKALDSLNRKILSLIEEDGKPC